MVGAPGHLAGQYPPPLRADGLVHLQVPPDISDRDDLVEPGMGDEDHVGVGAGGDGRERTARTGREQVGHVPCAGGQIVAASLFQPPDAPLPTAGRPVAALGEDHQRTALVEPARQPLDLLAEESLAGPAVLNEHVGNAVGDDVQAGIELDRRLHDDARPSPVDAQQVADQQQ
jgi:hypothetical protein